MEWHVMIWLVRYVMYVCACVCLHVFSYVHVFLYICKQIVFSLIYRYVHMHVHAFSVCVCTWAVDISKQNEIQQSCMTEWNYRQGQLSTPQTRSWDPSQVEGMGTRNSCRCGSPNSGLQRSAIWWSLSERVSSCALGGGLSCQLIPIDVPEELVAAFTGDSGSGSVSIPFTEFAPQCLPQRTTVV